MKESWLIPIYGIGCFTLGYFMGVQATSHVTEPIPQIEKSEFQLPHYTTESKSFSYKQGYQDK